MSTPGSGWFIKKPQQQQQQAQPKKIQGRGGTISSLISEGGGLGGAAAGAGIGTAILPGIGTLLGGAIGGVAGDLGGQSVENKVRDNSWHVDNPVKREALNGGLGLLPFGTVAGKGAKGFKAAREAGKVWHDAGENAPMFEVDDSTAKLVPNIMNRDVNSFKTVGDILDHPELYKHHPDIKNTPLSMRDLGGGTAGMYDEEYGMRLNPKYLSDEKAVKSTLLHELQHNIDKREGWTAGTTPEASGSMDSYNNDAGEARSRAVAARADLPESERYVPGTQWYHGSDAAPIIRKDGFKIMPPKGKEPIYGPGIYLTTDRGVAASHTKLPNGVLPVRADSNLKLYTVKGDEYHRGAVDTESLKKQGYDGLEVPFYDYDGKTVTDKYAVLFDPKKAEVGKPQPRSTFYDSYDVPKDQLIYRPAGAEGPAAFVRRPDKPTELMATHNLSADNLLHADKLGGLPQPSVGIVDPNKHVIDGFGDITLIGNNKLVDPKIKGNNTFASDVYSPRQPRGTLALDDSNDKKYVDAKYKIESRYGKYFKHYPDVKPHQFLNDSEDMLNSLSSFRIAPVMKEAYMDSIGLPIPKGYRTQYGEDAVDVWWQQHYDGQGGYTDFLKKEAEALGAKPMLHGGWTAGGSKRQIPETVDNALKVMRKTPLRGGEGEFGVGSIRAHITPKLKSVDDIYKNKDKLIPTREFNDVRDELDVQKEDLGYQIREALINHDVLGEDSDEVIKRYLTDKKPEDWIKNFQNGALAELGPELRDFRHALKTAPTEYFESVPNRAVNLHEFEKALVPEDTPQTVLDKLKGHGIETLLYNDTSTIKPGVSPLMDAMQQDAKATNLPTRAELLKQQMAEDNAKRFNPDGTPKIPTAAMLSAKNNEAIKAFDAGDKELGKKLTAEYNAMINLTRETTDGKLANGMTTKEITENLRTGKLNLNDLETDMDVGKIPMDEHKFVRQAINDYKNAKAAVFRTGPEQYKDAPTPMVARERFNLPALKKLSGGGSDRDVYDLGDGHVLKVSKTARGLIQNEAEQDYMLNGSWLPDVKEVGKNYVIAQKVEKPSAQTKALVKDLKSLNQYQLSDERAPGHFDEVDKAVQILDKHGMDPDVVYNYPGMVWGDMMSIRNWGSLPDGTPIHVDGGTFSNALKDSISNQFDDMLSHGQRKAFNLNDPEFNQIYHQSKAAKKKFGDTDKATMYGVAGAAAAGAAGWRIMTPDERKKRAQAA